MTDFIKKLEKELDIQIIHSKKHIWENYYDLDEDGNIKTLYLNKVDLKDIDVLLPIADSLINLAVVKCNIKTIGALKSFSRLESLSLRLNSLHGSTLSHLGHLKNLKRLDLCGTNIQDTSPLGSVTHLQELYIGSSNRLYEVNGLEGLKSLQHLDASYSRIDSIGKVRINENIPSLNVKGTNIKRIMHLERFSNLQSLNMESTLVEKIEGLDTLKNLKEFFISTYSIKRIEGLENLIGLEVLDLNFNKISKIEGLDNLTNLKRLNLNENQIKRVENLDNLVNLELLLLEPNNTVTYFDTSFFHNLVSECHIYLRDIKDIDVIQDAAPNNVKINFDNDYPYPTTLYRRPTGIFE
ncbi:leucine-rich repeat domain-containing protein [Chryseobacterium sp. C3]|uniref:leucine-rich repeat domain-containing protein n=1 Tax=Chryseobacterium sp. C3 TaxID=2761532 RepID=UPI001626D614|nr:leucine-rich repeat domain-containing protein [Chryseobacterium sp. C3]